MLSSGIRDARIEKKGKEGKGLERDGVRERGEINSSRVWFGCLEMY